MRYPSISARIGLLSFLALLIIRFAASIEISPNSGTEKPLGISVCSFRPTATGEFSIIFD